MLLPFLVSLLLLWTLISYLVKKFPSPSVSHNVYSLTYATSSPSILSTIQQLLPKRIWRLWFDMGVMFAVCVWVSILAASLWLIAVFVIGHPVDFRGGYEVRYSTGWAGKRGLVAVIPGVNLPWEEMGYYFASMIFVGIIHELGHAIAAITENVQIKSTGVFVFVVYPGAYVELNNIQLELLPYHKKLRISCAGVWHNLVLGVIVFLLLKSMPVWLAWGYTYNTQNVVVLGVADHSSLSSHMHSGTLISSLNNHPIENLRSWEAALMDAVTSSNTTEYCIPETSITQCCNATNTEMQCFSDGNEYRCGYLKEVVYSKCGVEECIGGKCMRLHDSDVRVRVVEIMAGNSEVLFLGDPGEIWEDVKVGSLVQRAAGIPVWIPYIIERFLQFTLSFTLALSVINIIPARYLDGHHALIAFVNMLMDRYFYGSESARDKDGLLGKPTMPNMRMEKMKGVVVKWVVRICTGVLGLGMVIGGINAFTAG